MQEENSKKEYKTSLEQAQKEYERSIPEKLLTIRNLIESIKKNNDKKSYEMLIFILHKLAGSAGCYGFKTASELCKTMRDELQEHRGGDPVSSLTQFLKRLENSFKSDSSQEPHL